MRRTTRPPHDVAPSEGPRQDGLPNSAFDPLSQGRRFLPIPWLTEAGVGAFFFIAVVLLILRQDYDPVHRYISEYAVGPGGWALRVGFVALGLASLNLALGFFHRSRPARGGRVGGALSVWAVAVLVAAAFPVDLQGNPVTRVGAVHLLASSVAFVSLIVAMVFAIRSFRRDMEWQALTRPTRWAALLTTAALILMISVFSSLTWHGAGQWPLFGVACGWLLLLSRHFRNRGRVTR